MATFSRESEQSPFPVFNDSTKRSVCGEVGEANPLAVLAYSYFTRYDRISEIAFHKHFCLVGVFLLGVILLMLSTERFPIHILSRCSGGRGDLYIVVRTAHN